MTSRFVPVALAVVSIGAAQLSAQRTSVGRPDLQGVWTNGTLTPLTRPAEFANRFSLTETEAAEFERTGFERVIKQVPAVDRVTAGDLSEVYLDTTNLKVVPDRRTALIVHDVRAIRIGGQHTPPNIRQWLGDSIGRWEGDTLVVDTTNFTDKTRFRGSGARLHVVERFNERGYDALSRDRRGSRHVVCSLDGRGSLQDQPATDIRIRVPRSQLLAREFAAWDAGQGKRR
jgi:hypothetical protein